MSCARSSAGSLVMRVKEFNDAFFAEFVSFRILALGNSIGIKKDQVIGIHFDLPFFVPGAWNDSDDGAAGREELGLLPVKKIGGLCPAFTYSKVCVTGSTLRKTP